MLFYAAASAGLVTLIKPLMDSVLSRQLDLTFWGIPVDLRAWSFVNADLTVVLWRVPRPPWILLSAETTVGEGGTGAARGVLADLDGPFGTCAQTLIFERR